MSGPGVVLLSGGMDSAVALYWAIKQGYSPIHAITFYYGQSAWQQEREASYKLWNRTRQGSHFYITLPSEMFASRSSILGRSPIAQYKDVDDAVANTAKDKSYIPLRNAIFITLAAHHLLSHYPSGGAVIVGTRARLDATGGFPDCTRKFAIQMQLMLTQAAAVPVEVLDPLNMLQLDRTTTVELAQTLPGCFEALADTVSCYSGTRCGKCIPCLRRSQAFERAGAKDPAA